METTENQLPPQQEVTKPPAPSNWKDNLPIKLSPALIISFSFLILIIVLLLILLLTTNRGKATVVIQPSPVASASPFVTERKLSAFSQTEEFKNFESHFNEMQSSINNIDLSEPRLSFPLLDMEVNYDK